MWYKVFSRRRCCWFEPLKHSPERLTMQDLWEVEWFLIVHTRFLLRSSDDFLSFCRCQKLRYQPITKAPTCKTGTLKTMNGRVENLWDPLPSSFPFMYDLIAGTVNSLLQVWSLDKTQDLWNVGIQRHVKHYTTPSQKTRGGGRDFIQQP